MTVAYSFTPSPEFSGPVYPSLREALNWAKGTTLHAVQMSGKWTEFRGGFAAEEMAPVVHADATDLLRHFARKSAWYLLPTFAGKSLTENMQGLYNWLQYGKISKSSWLHIRDWAVVNELMWMNGGHVEAAACNAVLTHVREPHYHAWLAGAHAKMELGKAEIARQEKSLRTQANKLFGAAL